MPCMILACVILAVLTTPTCYTCHFAKTHTMSPMLHYHTNHCKQHTHDRTWTTQAVGCSCTQLRVLSITDLYNSSQVLLLAVPPDQALRSSHGGGENDRGGVAGGREGGDGESGGMSAGKLLGAADVQERLLKMVAGRAIAWVGKPSLRSTKSAEAISVGI